MYDVQFSQIDKTLVYGLCRQAGTPFEQRLLDECVVGKQPGIGAQQALQHGVGIGVIDFQPVEFVTLYGNHDPRLGIGLFNILDISRLLNDFQGMVGGQYRKLECVAEECQVKIPDCVLSAPFGYLQVVA